MFSEQHERKHFWIPMELHAPSTDHHPKSVLSVNRPNQTSKCASHLQPANMNCAHQKHSMMNGGTRRWAFDLLLSVQLVIQRRPDNVSGL